MPEKYVLLWLEGPLQSWGVNSLFSRRASLEFPTRSGVMGLICSALGAGGEQRELLGQFAVEPMAVSGFARTKVANAPPVQLCDFHMVGSGYDDKDPWQRLHIPKKSDGKPAVGAGTKLTYRYYVQDMAFAVYLGVPAGAEASLAEALQFPCWDVALGRRSCVPVEFIYQGMFGTLAEARKKAEVLASDKDRIEVSRIEEEGEGEVLILSDVPVAFGNHKRYAERRVVVQRVSGADSG